MGPVRLEGRFAAAVTAKRGKGAGTRVAGALHHIMWLEAIFTRQDLDLALHRLAPFTLSLGEHGTVKIEEPTAVALVADRGLSVTCPATVHGLLFGLDVPVTIRSATFLLEPSLAPSAEGNVMLFRATVLDLDVSALPHLVEDAAVNAINKALSEHQTKLRWNFGDTLSHRFALPPGFTGAPSLDLRTAWGKLRVTSEALVFAVSIHQGCDDVTPRLASPAKPLAVRRNAHRARWIGAGAVAGLALGLTFVAAHLLTRRSS